MTAALVPILQALPASLRLSLTWDQGSELAQHRVITAETGTAIYFCHANSPWERGSNENMNGLLRQYFPKGSDLSVHTPEMLAQVTAEINSKPRKTLGWKTPAQLMATLLQASILPTFSHFVATTARIRRQQTVPRPWQKTAQVVPSR